jgi:hypothetical protein
MSDDFPDLKLKMLVSFPADANGGTGIDIVKSGGAFTVNLACKPTHCSTTARPGFIRSRRLRW